MLMIEILGAILIMITYFMIQNLVYMGIPVLKLNFQLRKRAFLITKENYSEKQGKVECAGYSSAYVYRHFGENAAGADVYNEMSYKNSVGHVYGKGILKLSKKYGFRAKLRTGNITALKNSIAKGNPVIVMIRTRVGATALHYVPAVGYDEDYFYIVDSMAHMRNEENPHYNRKIPISEFRRLWHVQMIKKSIVLTNLFIEIEK